VRGFEEAKEKKLYLATHCSINPVMVQFPLSKRGLKASRQATTQLLANSLHPLCQKGKNLIRLSCSELSGVKLNKGKSETNKLECKSGIYNKIQTIHEGINTVLK